MIQAVPIISEMGSTFIDVATLVDGAGNIFMGIVTDGNQNGVDIYKLTPNGTLTLVETVVPGLGGIVGHKVDHADLSHTGSNLVVGMITHDAVSAKPRSIRAELAQVVGVYAMRAGMEQEEGGAGAYQPIGDPQGGEPGMTLEELTTALQDQNSPVSVALGKIVKNKGRDAIGTEKVLTEDNFGAGGSPKAFQQLINTGFSANAVMAYLLGQWDGRLPNGAVWTHPLTGRPITDEQQWVGPHAVSADVTATESPRL